MQDPGQRQEIQMVVPPDKEAGVYSNFLGVWHSAYEFTLDFCATQPARPSDDDPGRMVMPCLVVSRIKIPVTLIFDVVRALNENMTRYEETFGEIKRPGTEG
ncbi:MAG TPA: DUF3467 domain-containing protein [Gaiellaceae bacterium]|nr:DUF3467 domain-containing protein [Gaiellaceae bacterium]